MIAMPEVRGHRAALVNTGGEHDRGPEGYQAFEMVRRIGDRGVAHRTYLGIIADPYVEYGR